MKPKVLNYSWPLLACAIALACAVAPVHAADKKPNILVIWGDDIGTWSISYNNRGMMGYAMTFLVTFKEFPPSQQPGSFNLDTVMKQLQSAGRER